LLKRETNIYECLLQREHHFQGRTVKNQGQSKVKARSNQGQSKVKYLSELLRGRRHPSRAWASKRHQVI